MTDPIVSSLFRAAKNTFYVFALTHLLAFSSFLHSLSMETLL